MMIATKVILIIIIAICGIKTWTMSEEDYSLSINVYKTGI